MTAGGIRSGPSAPLAGPGAPGGGSADGGGGSGGGWGGDPWGDGDDPGWERRRPGRVARTAALGVAVALVLATGGTWITVALEGSGPSFSASVVSVVAELGSGAQVRGVATVDDEVTYREDNGLSYPVDPSCSVAVVRDGRIVGERQVGPGPTVPGGTTVQQSVTVLVPPPAAGAQPDGASVACLLAQRSH